MSHLHYIFNECTILSVMPEIGKTQFVGFPDVSNQNRSDLMTFNFLSKLVCLFFNKSIINYYKLS